MEHFCDRSIERSNPTRDQMVQAARSGVQNMTGATRPFATDPRCILAWGFTAITQ